MFLEKFVKGFYAVSTVFQLLDGDSSQIQVSWTIFNQYLTSPLSWHWRASCVVFSHNPECQGGKPLLPVFLKVLVCRGWISNTHLPLTMTTL